MTSPLRFLLATSIALSPLSATFIAITDVIGGTAQITATPPNPVIQDPNDGILLAWNELQNVELTEDLRVDRVFDEDAPFVQKISGGFLIRAGTIVSSHYLQWDPAGASGRVEATIELDSQVFAFMTDDQKLFDSDDLLGLPGLDYNDFVDRGLEGNDSTTFNGAKVDISWRATSPGDWTRLITAFSPAAIPEPSTVALLALGSLGLLLLVRRRR
jgi:hypothetical protein